MSISTRGPNNILVLDRVVLPVNDVADEICIGRPITEICDMFRISDNELFEAVQAWADIRDLGDKDHINLSVSSDITDLSVVTTGITDWVFLNIMLVGKTHHPELTNNDKLYTLGLEHIITDCCYDVKNDSDGWEISDLHRLVFLEFNRHFPVNIDNVDEILRQLTGDEGI